MKFFLFFLCLSTVTAFAEPVCKKCEVQRDYNKSHPGEFEYYEDYLESLKKDGIRKDSPENLKKDAQSLNYKEQQTLAIIKPDAVTNHQIGKIISEYEKTGLRIIAIKMITLSKKDAETFYAVHKDRAFYPNLVSYMSSGPIVAMVIQGKNAIGANRNLIGNTDPKEALPNTIRGQFGTSKEKNAIHGSDSEENAKNEINFFFGS